MSVFAGINGVIRRVNPWVTARNGAVSDLGSLHAAYNGVRRTIHCKYRWEQWSIKTVPYLSYSQYTSSSKCDVNDYVYFYGKCKEDALGQDAFKLTDACRARAWNWEEGEKEYYLKYPYAIDKVSDSGLAAGNTLITLKRAYEQMEKVDYEEEWYTVFEYEAKRATKRTKTEKDQIVSYVESTDSSAFPKNGIGTDGYWYVRI